MLIPYHLTRFDCGTCGTFETGTPDRPDPAGKCPWCDGDLIITAQCRGATSRPLPFTSDPHRLDTSHDTKVRNIGDNTSEKRKRNNANGKSTGRPKGTVRSTTYSGPSDPVDVDRRYVERREREDERRSKQNGRRPADIHSEPQA